jgi:hypothetical protein
MTRDEWLSSIAVIDDASIESKFRKFVASQKGRKRLLAETSAITHSKEGQLDDIVTAFINMLEINARMCDLPITVMRHVESMENEPYSFDPSLMEFSTILYFKDKRTGATRRESLLVEGGEAYNLRTGDGIDDIVSLFNNGYSASARVWGLWHGEHTGSRMWRPPLHFIEKTIAQFNAAFRVHGIDASFWYTGDWT